MYSALEETHQLSDIPPHAYGWLEVDLGQISRNYHTLNNFAFSAECAAVVKANAYGLGLETVSQHLHKEGCKQFFVAHLDEALSLRKVLSDATIYVLSGCPVGMEGEFIAHNLIPIVNSTLALAQWTASSSLHQKKLPILLHIDTGMNRIGFDAKDITELRENSEILRAIDLKGIMSHLACSPEPQHEQNQIQLDLFETLCKHFPNVPRSLADTAGIYLGKRYQYDLVRPGKGLYGLFQAPTGPELTQAFTLKACVIQTREAKAGEAVGYGSHTKLTRNSTLATLGIGYGDGLDRRLANQGYVIFKGYKAPLVGSLSMDYTVVDVTDIPPDLRHIGTWAEVTGPEHPLEDIARDLGTISRELSTRFGSRMYRTEITTKIRGHHDRT